MTTIISPPKPKTPRIPTPTLREVYDAIAHYLQEVEGFAVDAYDIEGDREYGATRMGFFGPMLHGQPRDLRKGTIYGKACTSMNAKLWNYLFDVSIHNEGMTIKFDVMVEPLADRSIKVTRIARWENGNPVLAP